MGSMSVYQYKGYNMNIKEMIERFQVNIISYLSNKPIWLYWIVYTALIGLLFGLFYIAMFLLLLQWWVPVIVILAVGMIWGTFTFKRDSGKIDNTIGN